ncbi:hypothetical protein OG462_16250 [Streptomyces sp. NBC_01077]|uniref:hypothetical protein n=1 Tax=Streptomyces sp. NBC_01077 TaxID=2903746 RepID=UPI0038657C23|nr:hypothetical protein OG462_16250 [Streptomyces sp. NBC_01077]
MSMENPPPPALIRIPIRIVVLVVVLPIRMTWDALTATAHFLDRTALRPVGRGIAWVFTGIGRGLAWVFTGVGRGLAWVFTRVGRGLAWVFRHTVSRPSRWLYGAVLAPVGRGIAWVFTGVGRGIAVGAGWLWRGLSAAGRLLANLVFVWPWVGLWRYVVVPVCRYGIAVPAAWLYRQVLAPLGTGLLFLLEKAVFVPVAALFRYVLVPLFRYGVVVPVLWLWKRVLVPVAREVRDAFAVCWRVAGYLSRAVGRALKWMAWNVVGRPTVWAWRNVCTPVGHWVRDSVWAPARKAAVEAGRVARDALASARAAVREARRDAWRALVGGVRSAEPGEPEVARARTLGSTTNVPGAAPAPEISLRKRG